MRLVFADTGAFYALADRRDPAHERAREFHAAWDGAFLTTDFVFAESMSLLTGRLGKRTAVAFGMGLRESARFRIEEPTPAVREAAWRLFAGRSDKSFDLIDCLSFCLMEAFGVRQAFGFDRHFAQHGFELLPGG